MSWDDIWDEEKSKLTIHKIHSIVKERRDFFNRYAYHKDVWNKTLQTCLQNIIMQTNNDTIEISSLLIDEDLDQRFLETLYTLNSQMEDQTKSSWHFYLEECVLFHLVNYLHD